MPYKITIERTEFVTVKEEGEWKIIDRVPWTKAELDKKSDFYGDNYKELIAKEPLREVRGYTQPRDVIKEKTVRVYEQFVDRLNLKAVITAINS